MSLRINDIVSLAQTLQSLTSKHSHQKLSMSVSVTTHCLPKLSSKLKENNRKKERPVGISYIIIWNSPSYYAFVPVCNVVVELDRMEFRNA